uniref:Uncharacterized protein n=1 Tax=Rhizobium leguminosarum bv. viciae TaxID=387 RepID=A0A0U3J9D1_RHILV|nr:hypothetical protein [Rhizobium leguminosarum bv. viciae]
MFLHVFEAMRLSRNADAAAVPLARNSSQDSRQEGRLS